MIDTPERNKHGGGVLLINARFSKAKRQILIISSDLDVERFKINDNNNPLMAHSGGERQDQTKVCRDHIKDLVAKNDATLRLLPGSGRRKES